MHFTFEGSDFVQLGPLEVEDAPLFLTKIGKMDRLYSNKFRSLQLKSLLTDVNAVRSFPCFGIDSWTLLSLVSIRSLAANMSAESDSRLQSKSKSYRDTALPFCASFRSLQTQRSDQKQK